MNKDIDMEYWINFYVNKIGVISLLDDMPHTTQRKALVQIDDWDGGVDAHGIVWTYTHSIHMDGAKAEVTNLTPLVKDMNEQDRLDRAHGLAVTAGLRE